VYSLKWGLFSVPQEMRDFFCVCQQIFQVFFFFFLVFGIVDNREMEEGGAFND